MAWHGPAGQQIYYEESGSGDTVLLMPGWAGNIAEFGELRAELASGFRVVAVDLPGSGRSQPQPRHYSPGYYTDDARALFVLLDALGVGAAHLAGFSDGGEEALLMAALEPGRSPGDDRQRAAGFERGHEQRFLTAVAEAGQVGRAHPERVEQDEQDPGVVGVVARRVVPGLGL